MERLIWAVVVIVQFCLAAILIVQVIDTWDKNPVVTVTDLKPVSEIDFPAVTICPRGNYTSLIVRVS